MLFRLWGATDFRSTKDLDLEGFLKDEAEEIRKIIASICAQAAEDDGLTFDASSVTVAEIRDTQEYGGFRVHLAAMLGAALLRLQIDVGFGDAITPAPIVSDYPSILNQPRPRVRVYPRETVVAEKYEAMVQLGMTNSRMKDYYDLWFVSRHFEFEGSTLAAAMRATFDRRRTAVLADGKKFTSLKQQHRNLIAIDMEVYGVYAAAAEALIPTPNAVAIKAVSDFGDASKSDEFRDYATYVSAAVFREFAGTEYFELRQFQSS